MSAYDCDAILNMTANKTDNKFVSDNDYEDEKLNCMLKAIMPRRV